MTKLRMKILEDLQQTYISAVQNMALFPENSRQYKNGESLAMSTSHTVAVLYGRKETENLRVMGLREWQRIRSIRMEG